MKYIKIKVSSSHWKRLFIFFFIISLLLHSTFGVPDDFPNLYLFDAQPNPVYLDGKVTFFLIVKDDIGVKKIFLEDISGEITESFDCKGSKSCSHEFTQEFPEKGSFKFCAWGIDTSNQDSIKRCINVTVFTVSECEPINLDDSTQEVTIATRIKTKKLNPKIDGFGGYPLECCPYCQDLVINASNCEKLKGSFQDYRVVEYVYSGAGATYTTFNFPENILPPEIKQPFILCHVKRKEPLSAFGIIDSSQYHPLDFIYNEEKLKYWLINTKEEEDKNNAYPNSMAAIGDSITRAMNTEITFGDKPKHSWSTGDDPSDEVISHYEMILNENPKIKDNNHNYAVSGSKVNDIYNQAQEVINMDPKPEYITILIGGNDACAPSLKEMTDLNVFENEFDRTLSLLTEKLPETRILVVGLPDIYQLYDIGHKKGCTLVWDIANICRALTDPSNTEEDRLKFRERVIEYNKILKRITEKYNQVYSSSVFNYQFKEEDITWDCFHPSKIGQKKIAELTWADVSFKKDKILSNEDNKNSENFKKTSKEIETQDKYFVAEEDISAERETKEIVIVDSKAYSDAVNKLMLKECYHKQPESLECTFDCVPGNPCDPFVGCDAPCSACPWPFGCCEECQQVYDYKECVYKKFKKLWGRPYTDYLFCYKTPLKDTAWCKQRTGVSTSAITYPWYSFGIKNKTLYSPRNFDVIPQEYIDDIHEWNSMQEIKEMPDRSVIQHKTKVPETDCNHSFNSKLFRTVWTKIFTVTPYLNDYRNKLKWTRSGEGVVYAGGGFRREPACWWECCRMCAPMCNCDCIPCCNYCGLIAKHITGVTNIIKFTIPNVKIKAGQLKIIQDAPNQVTVSNGVLIVNSTGNMPFRITSAKFDRKGKDKYILTLVYWPTGTWKQIYRDQFVITQDIVFKYKLKEEAEKLIVILDEEFFTTLEDDIFRCIHLPGSPCPCLYVGSKIITTNESVRDTIGGITSSDEEWFNIEALKETAIGFINSVLPDVEVGLVSFGTTLKSFLDLTIDASKLHNEINSYSPSGRGCMGCGIKKATELLSDVGGEKYIIILSDGEPNEPGGNKKEGEAYARETAQAAADLGIVIHAVAIGDQAAEGFLKELAEDIGKGKFYAVSCDCKWDCISENLAKNVKNAVVLVNDVSESMNKKATLRCYKGFAPRVIHEDITRDFTLKINGIIDTYVDKFITQKGVINITAEPDIISKFILNVKRSKLEYTSLAYPVRHNLYRKEFGHGIWQPRYLYTPLEPNPEYGYLPPSQLFVLKDAYGYESRIPTAVNFEFSFPDQAKKICPPNCFCLSYDITDVTCVNWTEKPPLYYKRKDCICAEIDQTYLRPIYSTRTYHDEEFYYYDFIDLYTQERDEFEIIGRKYKEKPVPPIGGSISGNVTHFIPKTKRPVKKKCSLIKPKMWNIPSDAIILPTDPADAGADDTQYEPLRVHGLVWRLADCSLNPSKCNFVSKFKVGRIIGPITFLGVKYNAGPYVIVSNGGGGESPKSIVERVIAMYPEFKDVSYYEAGSSGSALTRQIFPLRVCIKDGSYDQPSHLFDEMLIPYKKWSRDCLNNSDVLIFGCPSGPDSVSNEEIRKFVARCGTYMATDWSYDSLKEIFPGYFTASKEGSGSATIWEGNTKGIYDLPDDLKEFFQTPYESVSGWHLLSDTLVIDSIDNPATKVIAKGDYSSGQTDKPMGVTFSFGDGRVFYYTVHIEGAASSSQKVFMSSFYSSAGMMAQEDYEEVSGPGTYKIDLTAIQFPELLTKGDFEGSTLTVFVHFRNNTEKQIYGLGNVKVRNATKIIIEDVEPSRYNLHPQTNIKVSVRLFDSLTGKGISHKKITVEIEGYGISQELLTDGSGRAIFSFTLGEKGTKVKFIFHGDDDFVPSEASDYYDVVSLKRTWWFLSPEVLLLVIVLIAIGFFYRWFKRGRINIEEMKRELKEEEGGGEE
jgi:lysophospholipase L1-like esterase